MTIITHQHINTLNYGKIIVTVRVRIAQRYTPHSYTCFLTSPNNTNLCNLLTHRSWDMLSEEETFIIPPELVNIATIAAMYLLKHGCAIKANQIQPTTPERSTQEQPTMHRNGYTVTRDEQVIVDMGLLDDLMNLISSSNEFKTWNSITTPDCFVSLAAIVMKANSQGHLVKQREDYNALQAVHATLQIDYKELKEELYNYCLDVESAPLWVRELNAAHSSCIETIISKIKEINDLRVALKDNILKKGVNVELGNHLAKLSTELTELKYEFDTLTEEITIKDATITNLQQAIHDAGLQYGTARLKLHKEIKQLKDELEKKSALREAKVFTIRIWQDQDGEYKVPAPDSREASTYFTDDKQDALNTFAKMWYKQTGSIVVKPLIVGCSVHPMFILEDGKPGDFLLDCTKVTEAMVAEGSFSVFVTDAEVKEASDKLDAEEEALIDARADPDDPHGDFEPTYDDERENDDLHNYSPEAPANEPVDAQLASSERIQNSHGPHNS